MLVPLVSLLLITTCIGQAVIEVNVKQADPCKPSPCGPNAFCRTIGDAAICRCQSEYIGNPRRGCYHECEFDSQCGTSRACIDHRCINPCVTCGALAICDGIVDHKPVCKCLPFYHGNPFIACKPECEADHDCPRSKPSCEGNRCRNPCANTCGLHANCTLLGTMPVCSCDEHLTGDPLELCRPWEKRDFCEPNPCKQNEKCELGINNATQKYIAECSCRHGYYDHGDGSCEPGECHEHDHCPDHKACLKHRCVDACENQCGERAICEPSNHSAVCSCPNGFYGNPTVSCMKKLL